jgi:hypothetical protein
MDSNPSEVSALETSRYRGKGASALEFRFVLTALCFLLSARESVCFLDLDLFFVASFFPSEDKLLLLLVELLLVEEFLTRLPVTALDFFFFAIFCVLLGFLSAPNPKRGE